MIDQLLQGLDLNHDGLINVQDLMLVQPGSAKAKQIWEQVDKQAHSEESILQAKKLGHENAKGLFEGKALVPGESGIDQGDFNFLVQKLHWYNGYSLDVAQKIAAKVKIRLYGGR